MTPALRELVVVALFIGPTNLATGRCANHGRAPMRRPYHYRRPNLDRRRALELLAGSRYGYTRAILRAHGFSIDMMIELVKAGLATTKRERMVADGRQIGVVRMRITDAGRQGLPPPPPAEKATASQAAPVLKRVGYSALLLVGVLLLHV
jgi:hypothetical protein